MIRSLNEYVVAGYALIWASLLWYAWRLRRRLAAAAREISEAERDMNQ